ncbi:Mrp/NBP35 family ATP-binding protein [Actinoplanes sp. TRM 88003]|uniref:Mrp/NBP35 family ATP-binding protein n=1 Tax=Paractinoplanes aksuensis TaxID=2939490 RepID=A0ABT1DEK7_9ACTN|nr:Mrp/NBP35 family ATP-binding protein [Actinoplanes aksuensis]MCO8269240.1 Mrp/NBP35 family ATP-binding protein [Actinoplanes aksuensis]
MGETPIIAVASGKGGVGKTSVAVALGRQLARAGRRAGLVDADIAGPDVPRMLGIRRDAPARTVTLASWNRGGRDPGLEAVEVDGLKVASAGFLVAGNQGLALGTDLADLMLGRLLKETDWGDVEVLVVDLPPGISFTQQGVLAGAGRVGTILVVTPAEVSHLDTGRALSVLRSVRTPVLGGVENMAYFACPHCGEQTDLHTPAPADRTIWADGVKRLARLPFRPDGVIEQADLAPVLATVDAHIG